MHTLIPLSEERTVDNQIQFLQFAIVDTQELTRYMDQKAGFVLIILGAIWSVCIGFLADAHEVTGSKWLFYLNFSLFLLNLLYVSFLAVHCVTPINNPSGHIDFEGLDEKDKKLLEQNLFFLPSIRSNGILNSNLNQFIYNIKNMVEDDIVKVLSFEFQKVSYLRNIKMMRFRDCYSAMYRMLIHMIVFTGIHYYLLLHSAVK